MQNFFEVKRVSFIVVLCLFVSMFSGCDTMGQKKPQEPLIQKLEKETKEYDKYAEIMDQQQKDMEKSWGENKVDFSDKYQIVHKKSSIYLKEKDTEREEVLLKGVAGSDENALSYGYYGKIDDTKFVYTASGLISGVQTGTGPWGIYDIETKKAHSAPEDLSAESLLLITENAVYARYVNTQTLALTKFALVKLDITEIKQGSYPEDLGERITYLLPDMEVNTESASNFVLNQNGKYCVFLKQNIGYVGERLGDEHIVNVEVYNLETQEIVKTFQLDEIEKPKKGDVSFYRIRLAADNEVLIETYYGSGTKRESTPTYVITLPA